MKGLIGYCLAFLTLVTALVFVHPHYDKCKQTIEGRECVLTHYTFGIE
jgi:hypothetical protein